jgi:hypothetical protein
MEKQKSSHRSHNRGNSYDHNNPIKICKVCSTIGDWHCYECSNNFCSVHFSNHKEMQLCIIH